MIISNIIISQNVTIPSKILKAAKKKYESVEQMYGTNLIKVMKNNKYGILSSGLIELVPLLYEELRGIEDGVIIAKMDGKYGVINTMGETVVPFIYDDLYQYFYGPRAAKLNGKWGFIDREGKQVAPFMFDRVGAWHGSDVEKGWMYCTHQGDCVKINRAGNILQVCN